MIAGLVQSFPSSSVVVPVALGCSLRLYELIALENANLSDGLASLLWTSLPFGVALLMGLTKRLHDAAVGFVSACLLALFYSHYVLFIAPSPDSSSVLIVFFPVWSLFVVGPVGVLVGWAIGRMRKRGGAA